ncbi:MAG: adenine-specific methyltransferase EcoRI family protein [Deferribacteraceae bacterium]|jgi:hypothetical protein|nr:adenine-specific methyltransferase EcoRI family protein [Deferribacteraceae bacterium]
MASRTLNRASKAKNDEFYTQITDIEKECLHYREHFKGKVVFCNCDDPETSDFWRYFHIAFSVLGLTNPPFSLFREYVAQLIKYDKKFLIIGNKNAITYKEIFPLIRENKLWLGFRNINSDVWFAVAENQDYEKIINGKKMKHISACWFTNLEIKKRLEKMILFRTYKGHEDEYPKYDNYDAIEVSKVENIPIDYDGVMGVPITFLDKYNPNQFEIIRFRKGVDEKDLSINGKHPYFRILIRRRTAG